MHSDRLFVTASRLPLRVASHFDGAGTPDGWMLRGPYLWTMAGVSVGLNAFLVGIFYSVRYFPTSTFNLPHRDYWLAAERRGETFAFLFARRRVAGDFSSGIFVWDPFARRGCKCVATGQAFFFDLAAGRRVSFGDDCLDLFYCDAIPTCHLTSITPRRARRRGHPGRTDRAA